MIKEAEETKDFKDDPRMEQRKRVRSARLHMHDVLNSTRDLFRSHSAVLLRSPSQRDNNTPSTCTGTGSTSNKRRRSLPIPSFMRPSKKMQFQPPEIKFQGPRRSSPPHKSTPIPSTSAPPNNNCISTFHSGYNRQRSERLNNTSSLFHVPSHRAFSVMTRTSTPQKQPTSSNIPVLPRSSTAAFAQHTSAIILVGQHQYHHTHHHQYHHYYDHHYQYQNYEQHIDQLDLCQRQLLKHLTPAKSSASCNLPPLEPTITCTIRHDHALVMADNNNDKNDNSIMTSLSKHRRCMLAQHRADI